MLRQATAQERVFSRVRLTAPVSFGWKTPGMAWFGDGITRDMSARGMYVVSETSPPLATVVRCNVCLPPLEPSQHVLTGIVVGRVIRVDETGFAVTSKVFVLRSDEARSN